MVSFFGYKQCIRSDLTISIKFGELFWSKALSLCRRKQWLLFLRFNNNFFLKIRSHAGRGALHRLHSVASKTMLTLRWISLLTFEGLELTSNAEKPCCFLIIGHPRLYRLGRIYIEYCCFRSFPEADTPTAEEGGNTWSARVTVTSYIPDFLFFP